VIWLSVWQYNKRAIKFYERFEFYSIGEHIFDLAGDSQIDFIMQKKMKEKR
jgi:ribosomal protein S18 acetylase RimI-like enzyme